MNIGVTGATGFLGSYFVKYLLKNPDYKVWAFTRKALDSADENLKYIVGDIASEYDCEQLVKNIDVLIHLAHTNSPINSNNDVLSDTTLNLVPSLTLFEKIKKLNRKIKVIYISSGGTIYGESKTRIPFKETDMCSPTSSYAIQKLAIENYIKLWSDHGYISSVVLRLSNPYGVLLPSSRKQGVVGIALSRLLNNETFYIYGNPENVRDYVHLDDMCIAIEKAIHYKTEYEVFNIGSGKGYSVAQIVNLIEESTSLKFNIEYVNDSNLQKMIDWTVLDISKAEKKLCWVPKIGFKKGLKTLCEKELENMSQVK